MSFLSKIRLNKEQSSWFQSNNGHCSRLTVIYHVSNKIGSDKLGGWIGYSKGNRAQNVRSATASLWVKTVRIATVEGYHVGDVCSHHLQAVPGSKLWRRDRLDKEVLARRRGHVSGLAIEMRDNRKPTDDDEAYEVLPPTIPGQWSSGSFWALTFVLQVGIQELLVARMSF
ncbi:hypothetical protein PISMIDRAFT_23396 [Pisolithus microcarpus 441]|uniref:Uncharacterized protein n=1 Tax=Pisolithus microcarpus 441 TaxID=765257 RepID=A0A0C9YFL4_9AGAM|nr:hypothetical protein PISMIDRAFT_23396 [Pisolithus microcarpus 441]